MPVAKVQLYSILAQRFMRRIKGFDDRIECRVAVGNDKAHVCGQSAQHGRVEIDR